MADVIFPTLIILNAVFFIFYGLQCFFSPYMKQEFLRFGLSNAQRQATGSLQLLGAAGLFSGFIFPILGFLASIGLTLMMGVAFLVRIKLKDGLLMTLPSFIFLLLNAFIALLFYSII